MHEFGVMHWREKPTEPSIRKTFTRRIEFIEENYGDNRIILFTRNSRQNITEFTGFFQLR